MGVLDFGSAMLHRTRGQRRDDEDPYDPYSPYGPATPPFNPYSGGGAPSDVNPTAPSTPSGGFDERLSRAKRTADSIANPGDELTRTRDYYRGEFEALGAPPEKKHRLLKAIGAGAAMMTPITGMFANKIYDGGYSRKLGEYAAREKNLMDRYSADVEMLGETMPTRMKEQGSIYREAMSPQVNERVVFDPYSGTQQTLMDKDDRLVGADGSTIADNPAPTQPKVQFSPRGQRAAVIQGDDVEFQEFEQPPEADRYSSAAGIGIFNQRTGEVTHAAPPRPSGTSGPPSVSALGGEVDRGDMALKDLNGWISEQTANVAGLLNKPSDKGGMRDNPEQGYQLAKQTADRIGSRVEQTRRQMQARADLHKQSGQPQLAAALEQQIQALPDATAYQEWAEGLKPEAPDDRGFFPRVGDAIGEGWDALFGSGDPEVIEDPNAPPAPGMADAPTMTREDFIQDFVREEGRAPTAAEIEHFRGKVWQ